MREDSRQRGKTGSAHAFYPGYPRSPSRSPSPSACRCNSSRVKLVMLLVLVCLLACVTAGFLGFYFRDMLRGDNKDVDDICTSLDCVEAAHSLAQKMNSSVDPCEDFAQFACGNFYNTVTLREGMTSVSSFTLLREDNDKLIRSIVSEEEEEEEASERQHQYVRNMKRLYTSCMEEDTIERIGLRPYLQTDFAKQWPTLIGQNWSTEATFDLNEVNSDYMSVGIYPLFAVDVILDPLDASRKTLAIVDPDLSYGVFHHRTRDSPQVLAYEKVLRDLAVELGGDTQLVAQDIAQVVDLEMELSKTAVSFQERRRNLTSQMNVFTLSALAERYTVIDIPMAIKSVFAAANITVEESQTIMVPFPQVLDKMFSVIQNTSTRTVQNLFSFKHAYTETRGMTKRIRENSLMLEKVLSGKTEERPRTDVCLSKVRKAFPYVIGKEFLRRKNFSQDQKIYVNSMIDNLKIEFENQLHSIQWMGNTTKIEALRKLSLLTRQVGYPDRDFSEEEIDRDSQQYTMKADSYYENIQTLRLKYRLAALQELKEKTDKHTWASGPHIVNAYYSRLNSIFLPAGLLQPPFFSLHYPDSLNYGSLGHVIGHEITHGFDDIGSQFDRNGNFRNWWQPEDQRNFAKTCQCLVQQYSNFQDNVTGLYVNGVMTQGENVADNGGLKQSYRAYKRLTTRRQKQARRLPGLKLTNDQIFFLSYAQLWCEKSTKETRRREMQSLNHPIGEFRILGPLQNLPEFSSAYHCPVGSRMNPHRKCDVW